MLRKFIALLSLSAVLVTTGCGLRLESSQRDIPETDPQETARQLALDSVNEISAAAASVGAQIDAGTISLPDDAATAQLEALVESIDLQVAKQRELLGPDGPTTKSDDSDEPEGQSPQPTQNQEDVSLRKFHVTIVDRGQEVIDTLPQLEPELARLIGSIAAAMIAWDTELDSLINPEDDSDGDQDQTRSVSGVPLIDGLLDLSTPDARWAPLVKSWDRAGYLLEVAAARGGEGRDSLTQSSREYRSRAQEWAKAIGIAGGDSDPRESAYETPELSGDFTADVEALQDAVRETIREANFALGDLLFSVEPNQRGAVAKELAAIRADNQRWGIAPTLMLGLREQPEELVLN